MTAALRVFFATACVFATILDAAWAGESNWLKGEVVDRRGFVTSIEKIAAGPESGRIAGMVSGLKTVIPFNQLRRIENFGGLKFLVHYHNGDAVLMTNGEFYSRPLRDNGDGVACYKTGERGSVGFLIFDQKLNKERIFILCQAYILVIAFEGNKVDKILYDPATDEYYPPSFDSNALGGRLIGKRPKRWNTSN